MPRPRSSKGSARASGDRQPKLDAGELYRRYGPLVLRRVRQFVSEEEAEELVHEVFVKVIERAASFRQESSPATWLYRLTTNHCINFVRDRTRRRELLAEHGPALWQQQSVAAQQEPSVLLNQIWRQLNEELAMVGAFFFVDGMTLAEIGRIMGYSDRTVANRLKRIQEIARAAVAQGGAS